MTVVNDIFSKFSCSSLLVAIYCFRAIIMFSCMAVIPWEMLACWCCSASFCLSSWICCISWGIKWLKLLSFSLSLALFSASNKSFWSWITVSLSFLFCAYILLQRVALYLYQPITPAMLFIFSVPLYYLSSNSSFFKFSSCSRMMPSRFILSMSNLMVSS